MKRTLLALLVTAIAAGGLLAQNPGRTCATMDHLDYLLAQNPRLALRMQAIEQHTQNIVENGEPGDGTLYTIPVVVHVVWNTPSQNISDAQIQSQIDVLNEDFRRQNSDASQTQSQFVGVAADSEIEFCLATTDPQGNPTNGITRTQTSTTLFNDNDNVKFNATGGHDAWPAGDYLNIWVCPLAFLGYAQFPGGPANTDGIVCDSFAFGRFGSAQAPFHLGRTATHEVGHWLNLRHIWGDGGCGFDDFVSDTPVSDAPNYGCALNHVSCGSVDMVQNYMDYSDDGCMNVFTQGQRTRMRAQLNPGGFRNSLLSSPGCNAQASTVANFTASPLSGFTPLTVNFTDTSTGGPTSWTWTFGDGGTSNQQNPSHTYTNPGSYNVVLAITGPNGSDTEVKTGYITVSTAPGPGINDGSFESQTAGGAPGLPWTVTGTGHEINPAGGVSSDNGFASDGTKWADLAADDTDNATPPSNPGGVSSPAMGGAGVAQSFSYSSGVTMLSFTAAFIRNETANSQYNDFMSVDITDGTTTRNLYYRDTFSPTGGTSAKHGLAMTAAETITVDLASLYPSSTTSTIFTLTAHVGNGFDDIQPSRGYLDDVRLDGQAVQPPVAEFVANPTVALTGQTVTFTNQSTGTFASSSWTFGDGNTSTATSPTHTYTSPGTYTVTLVVTGPGGSDAEVKPGYITVSDPPDLGTLYMSFLSTHTVPGVGTVDNEDIVAYDIATGTYSLHFDGSDVGLAATNVNAAHVFPGGEIIFSISAASFTIPGLIGGPGGSTTVSENDVILFLPTSTGTNTAGTMWFVIDGSDIGLDSGSEDIDGLWMHSSGAMVMSTSGNATPNGIAPLGSEDAMALLPSTYGDFTTGIWLPVFDGSDVSLTGSGENMDALHLDLSLRLLFSTTGNWTAGGASGTDEDIGRFTGGYGLTTVGSIELLHDISATGLTGGADVDALTFIEP